MTNLSQIRIPESRCMTVAVGVPTSGVCLEEAKAKASILPPHIIYVTPLAKPGELGKSTERATPYNVIELAPTASPNRMVSDWCVSMKRNGKRVEKRFSKHFFLCEHWLHTCALLLPYKNKKRYF